MFKKLYELSESSVLTVLGLMSGTSADGLDMCLVRFSGRGRYPDYECLETRFYPYPRDLANASKNPLELSGDDICRLHMRIGKWVGEMISKSGLDADCVATHGQTLLHRPPLYTLQIGESAWINRLCGLPVIYDFRTADVIKGGQGAPLIPVVDDYLLRHSYHSVLSLNMGGIANITCLPPRESDLPVIAWDTGPANTLIDKTVQAYTRGAMNYDEGGKFASQGKINTNLYRKLTGHPYFKLDPPKSAGQEQFGGDYAREIISEMKPVTDTDWLDCIRTVTEMTVFGIKEDIISHYHHYRFRDLYASGGGTANSFIMKRLNEELPDISIHKLDLDGITTDNKEAFGFAYLGYLFMKHLPGNVRTVTGAENDAVLGKICF